MKSTFLYKSYHPDFVDSMTEFYPIMSTMAHGFGKGLQIKMHQNSWGTLKFPKDMINHIDEHNTGILDFPAFYNLVKKKSRDQVPMNHHTAFWDLT